MQQRRVLGTAITVVLACSTLAPVARATPLDPAFQCTSAGPQWWIQLGDNVGRWHHCVEVEPGVLLHVIETTPDAAVARSPERALLLMPATLVTGRHWDSDVDDTDDYSGLARGARAGFHTYTFDYYGYGSSTKPASGLDANRERLLAHTGALIEWIRARSGAAQVDMSGISLGSLLAFAVGGVGGPVPASHVGKLVLTSIVYKNAALPLQLTLLSPAGCAAMANSPNGYLDTNPAIYAPLIGDSEPEAQLWCYQNCPGRYSAGPTLTGCALPVFEASIARAPALILLGSNDKASERTDVDRFVAEYGGPKEFRVLQGGAHTFHWEAIRDDFWEQTFDFLG